MKNINNKDLEADLNSISNLKAVGAPDFFYTRLKARMEKQALSNESALPLQPIVVICALTLFLFINSLLLENDSNRVNANANQEMEALAASYDQTISN